MERDKLISLVSKAKQGDPDALNDLFNAFYNDVYYFALKTVKDDQVACDVTQETFIEVINTLDQLEQEAAFVTWLKKITYHQCTRYFKKKKDVIVDEDEDGNTVFDTLQEEKADFIPEEALDKEDFKKTIMGMIDNLSEEQRAAVMMFYYDELSIKQIAEIQNTNENTVKSRLNYAKKGIKKSVEDYEKKNGVKLHCVGVLPLLLWLFKDYFAQSAPATATAVAEGVAAATGTSVAITTTATATTVTTTAATTTAVGVGAKIASLPLVTKIVAGIVAAALVIGGATTAIVVSNNNNGDSPTEPTSHEWSEWKQTVAPSYTAKGEEVRTCSICSATETREIAQLSLENTFKRYPDIVADLGFFATIDELSSLGVFDWAIAHIDATSETKDFDNYIFTYTYSVDSIDAFTNRYLGRTWDYSSVNYTDPGGTEYIYDGAQNSVAVVYHGAFGDAGPEITYNGYAQIDDTHFEITYSKNLYGETTNGIIKVQLTGNNLVVTSHSLAADTTEDSNNNSQYYDPYSRMHKSTLTIEELGKRALANAEQTGGETYEDPPTAIYAVDYAASCFKDMDIFGYGVTVDEMCGLGWGGVDFFSNLIGEDMAVQLNNANFYLTLPLKEQAMGLKLAIKDVEAFTALLNGAGDPYVSVGGTSKRGLDSLTDEALMNAVDGSGSSPVEIFTSERFAVDGKEFGLSMTINSSMEDGVFCYRIGLSIYFFNE